MKLAAEKYAAGVFECIFCGRDDFTCISHLKKHRTSHTPEEKTNLVCPHCDRVFSQASAYGGHVMAHDEEYRAQRRFWPRVDKSGPVPDARPDLGPCWLWTGPLDQKGYGLMHVPPATSMCAYKYAYERVVGPVPEGLELDHLCFVRPCVNPSHLEPVTRIENCRRMHARPENRASCPECGLTTNKGNIARHMKFKHPELVEASVRKGHADE